MTGGCGLHAGKSGSRTGKERAKSGGETDCKVAEVGGSIAGVDRGDGLEEREAGKGVHVLVT